MDNVDQILIDLGGREVARRICGISDEAIKKWRQKGYVPPKHWAVLTSVDAGKMTYERLALLKSEAA